LQTMSGEKIEISEKFTEIFKAAYAPYLNWVPDGALFGDIIPIAEFLQRDQRY
jgi:hypothetical protein